MKIVEFLKMKVLWLLMIALILLETLFGIDDDDDNDGWGLGV